MKYKQKIQNIPIKFKTINYKDITLLQNFLTQHGKIFSRRSTKLKIKQQKELKISIKRARNLNLLPFVIRYKS